MSARQEDVHARIHRAGAVVVEPFEQSTKIYVEGSRPDIQVPMREILLSTEEKVHVYDTSGPFSDPAVQVDLRQGLEPLRTPWIEDRGDTEILGDLTSSYGQQRAGTLSWPHSASIRRESRAVPEVVKM